MLFKVIAPARAQNIVTVCGNGFAGYYGNGIPATLAQLCSPDGVAVDAAGNILFCDASNNKVRKISSSGVISDVAGTGAAVYSGDGGPATAACFNSPQNIAIDYHGNIFIGETGVGVVRKINPAGIISTVAGSTTGGMYTDGAPATSVPLGYLSGICVDAHGALYISLQSEGVVRKVDTFGIINTIAGNYGYTYDGDNVPATDAALNYPSDLKFNSLGQLLIADMYDDRVRMVDTFGIIHTVYYDSMAGYSVSPGWLTVDASNNIFISDFNYANGIIKVTTSGLVTKFAGNGSYGFSGDGSPATDAGLAGAQGIGFDNAGNLVIADNGNNRIRKVSTDGIIHTIAGGSVAGYGDGGMALSAELYGPGWVTKDASGNLYIADIDASRVRKVDATGIISTFAGTGIGGSTGDGGPANAAQIYYPQSIDFDQSGNLFICDAGENVIRKVNTSGIISTVAGTAGTAGSTGDGGPASLSLLNIPVNLKVDQHNRIFICDRSNRKIRMIDTTGIITTIAGNGTAGNTGDGGPATAAEITSPHGIDFDAAGNLYFADASNCVIRKITPSGIISTVAGTGSFGFSGDGGPATAAQFAFPCAIAIDPSGNIFVSDENNSCIRKIDASGIIHTVIGVDTAGFAGDGGPANVAKMNLQYGISFDQAGNLYIADWGNHRIRKVIYNLSVIPVDMNADKFTVYPNPSKGMISVNVHTPTDMETEMSISDLTGKVLVTREIKTNSPVPVNVDLPDDLYIISVLLPEGRASKKVIFMK